MREWSKLSQQQKVAAITRAIDLAAQDGTEIRLPATYYVSELDALRRTYVASANHDALESSVGASFRTIAVMEGDWDTGQPKIEQAKTFLGSDLFEEFKARHPDKYQHLLELDRNVPQP